MVALELYSIESEALFGLHEIKSFIVTFLRETTDNSILFTVDFNNWLGQAKYLWNSIRN